MSINVPELTTSIEQETGVITFTVGGVIAGDYVATVTCGDATPIEITITVTAPECISLRNTPTSIRFTSYNSPITVKYTRNTQYSQGSITFDDISQYTWLTIQPKSTMVYDSSTGTFYDEFYFTQTEPASAGNRVDIYAYCGSAQRLLAINPNINPME